jgi:ABC-type proline/glycine betaine transport system permease subunit
MAFKLEENEYIIAMSRRHWFFPVSQSLLAIFSLLLPILIMSVVFNIKLSQDIFGNSSLVSLIVLLVWFFIVWNFIFIIWTDHFLDVLIITNLHLIDIENIGLWNREISTLKLKNIQDISSKVIGIIPSILKYGDLEIQTAGSMNNFIIKNVQNPDLVRQKINAQIAHH